MVMNHLKLTATILLLYKIAIKDYKSSHQEVNNVIYTHAHMLQKM